MIETRAVVIRIEGNEAIVEATQGGGCGNCDSENGCGTGKLSQLFCSEPRRFRVLNEADAKVGTMVQITLPEGMLLRSALLMYMLPLLMLFGGAVAGAYLQNDGINSDLYSAIGGLAGLSLGFLLVKSVSLRRRLASVARPVIASTVL